METSGWDRRRAAAAVASVASFCGGCSFGWLSPYYSQTGDSQSVISSMGSVFCLGGAVATPIFGMIAGRWGRKNGLLIATVPLIISWIVKIWYRSVPWIMASRLAAGLGSSGSMMLTPLYLEEIYDGKFMGKSMIISFAFANFGILFAYAMYEMANYDVFLWSSLGIAVLYFMVFAWMPESPVYLMKNDRENEAIDAISWLRKTPTIESHRLCREIRQNSASNQQMFIWPGYVKIASLCLMLFSIQSVGYCIVGCSSQIFKFAAPTLPQDVSSVVLASFQILGSVVSLMSLTKWGHKILFVTSTVIFSFGMATLALYFYFNENAAQLNGYVTLLIYSLSVMAFSIGMQPMPFMIISATFAIDIRSYAGIVFLTWTWLTTGIFMQFYHNLTVALEMHGTYLMFAIVTGIALLAYFFASKVKEKRTEQLSAATDQNDKTNSDAMNALL